MDAEGGAFEHPTDRPPHMACTEEIEPRSAVDHLDEALHRAAAPLPLVGQVMEAGAMVSTGQGGEGLLDQLPFMAAALLHCR